MSSVPDRIEPEDLAARIGRLKMILDQIEVELERHRERMTPLRIERDRWLQILTAPGPDGTPPISASALSERLGKARTWVATMKLHNNIK